MAQTVKNLPAIQGTQVPSLGQEDPLEKEMATHSSIVFFFFFLVFSFISFNDNEVNPVVFRGISVWKDIYEKWSDDSIMFFRELIQ